MFSKGFAPVVTFMLVIGALGAQVARAECCPSHSSTTEESTVFQVMTEDYLAVQASLAADSMDGIRAHALAIQNEASGLEKDFQPASAGVSEKEAQELKKALPTLEKAAGDLAQAETIEVARNSFGRLSELMIGYRNITSGNKPQVAYCPMAKKSWMQDGTVISNPYFGSSMLRCGSIVDK